MADYTRRLDKLEESLVPKRKPWSLPDLLTRMNLEQRGEPLPPELQGEPWGPLVDALNRIGREGKSRAT